MLVAEVEHDSGLDARRFAPVVAALQDLTPRVEVLTPGCCVVATRGPSRYYGGDKALAVLVHDTIAKVLADASSDVPADASVRVGIADGLFAAGRAARLAPTGVMVVPPGGSAAFLSGLSLWTLAEAVSPLAGGAGERTTDDLIDMLWHLGLRSLGDLAALPVGDLVGRFGTQGEWMHALASGRDPHLSQPAAVRPDLCVATEIDPAGGPNRHGGLCG